MESEEKELIELPTLPTPSEERDQDIDIFSSLTNEKIAKLEAAIESYKKIITLSIRLTNHQDWVDQSGKPYLQSSGAEKVANPFGIDIDRPTEKINQCEDEKGRFVTVEYWALVSSKFLGRQMWVVGTRSSRDPFFSEYSEWTKDADGNSIKTKRLRPQSEVDINDIKKSALSNLTVNAVTRLLGIRNLTWEQVKAGGIEKDKVAGVDYSKKGGVQNAAPQTNGNTEELRKKSWEMLLQLCAGDVPTAKSKLQKMTTFKKSDGTMFEGWTTIDRLTEKSVPVFYGKVKAEFDAVGRTPKSET